MNGFVFHLLIRVHTHKVSEHHNTCLHDGYHKIKVAISPALKVSSFALVRLNMNIALWFNKRRFCPSFRGRTLKLIRSKYTFQMRLEGISELFLLKAMLEVTIYSYDDFGHRGLFGLIVARKMVLRFNDSHSHALFQGFILSRTHFILPRTC